MRRSVGLKIALATSSSLLFVTVLFLIIFNLLGVELLSKFNLIQLIIVFVSLLVFVEILLVMSATGFFVGRPLQKLRDVMSVAEEGNFLVRAVISTRDELGELASRFNAMLAKITDLDARKIDAERELVMVSQNLKYQSVLAEKALLIEQANQKLEASLKDISLLYHISQSLGQALELNEFLNSVRSLLTETLSIKTFSLLFYNETREWLTGMAAHGFNENERIHGMIFKPGEGIAGQVAVGGGTIYIHDASKDNRYLHYQGEKNEGGSVVSLPLSVLGTIVGVLNVSHSKSEAFSETDIQSLESAANQIAMAFERSRLYMKVKELSVTDELTGLYNRRHFQNVLSMEWKRAHRFSRPLSLLMCDVDYFKKYNDTFGHVIGDLALKNIAAILLSNVREVDTVARFGGEEIVILLPDTSLGDALHVGDKLRLLVESRTSLEKDKGGVRQTITLSIGVSNYPDMVREEDELLNLADSALYQAKALGRNRVVAFNFGGETGGKGRMFRGIAGVSRA